MLQLSEDGPGENQVKMIYYTKQFDGLWERFVFLSSLVQSVCSDYVSDPLSACSLLY
jgi:hypothetical protein